MNKIGTILMIVGAACILCAASSDDYYETIGEYYSLKIIILPIIIGSVSIIAGYKIRNIKEEK